jgi:hypothetical protein
MLLRTAISLGVISCFFIKKQEGECSVVKLRMSNQDIPVED